ncbi:MAG: dihydroorotase, partial [Gemmatimonadetes bacterium]|nr:dihydroorotase [Gemmatimonadota bacterium]
MTNPTCFLHSPLDMHIHFREGDMLRRVAPLSARTFAGGVIMPNLVPPVDDFGRLERYAAEVRTAVAGHAFEPYMTLFMRPYTERELASMKDRIIGVKLYPEGVTTHSDTGVGNLRDVEDTLARMEDMGIRLMVHGETSDFVLDRERAFLPVYEDLAARFPRLDIVMEHITTREAAALLDRHENMYATVTLQHLLITLDDVAGGLLNPHLFCKPIAKRPEDRDALLARALEAHPKLAFGSDSAPHPVDRKECAGCAAGVFTAPVALQMLVGLFEENGALDRLQAFVSDNAQRIYGVAPPEKTVVFEKTGAVIPERYGDVIPMYPGRKLDWTVADVR